MAHFCSFQDQLYDYIFDQAVVSSKGMKKCHTSFFS
jgi:hypothetical protein